MPAAAEPVPVLRAPQQRVSPRAPVVWLATAFLRDVVAVGALVVVSGPWDWFAMPVRGWALVWLALLASTLAMPALRYATHRWETTPTAVYTQTGWLTLERSAVIGWNLRQSLFQRRAGVVTMVAITAAGRQQYRLPDVPEREAATLVAEVCGEPVAPFLAQMSRR